jgi:pilus assembly protein Flp/PilA
MYLWLANAVSKLLRDEEGQGVSEYAMILVLIVLIVVSVVHALGSNAQQVIDKVNTALHIG